MGGFALQTLVPATAGDVLQPNTFASVDHPFHVARAETLWRELATGHMLRWIGQHHGGYPVEFYPLGEAWIEVAVRAASFGSLTAEGAHTLAVIAIFLLPGAAFALLARQDGFSPVVALSALALHVAFPGSWYDGGYTELVQWGLVTNVAGAVAALTALPALNRFLITGDRRAAALAAALSATAIYCNPRATIGLAALAVGAWIAAIASRHRISIRIATKRIGQIGVVAGLLAAPEIVALLRFGNLYTFVHYSGYDSLASFARAAADALSLPILALGMAGVALAFISRRKPATLAVAASLLVYGILTIAIAFVPMISNLASQLEPTRLMPLQRLLTIYLAAASVWAGLAWLFPRMGVRREWLASLATGVIAVAVVVVQTRPLSGPPPDPASRVVPAVSLYPVATSGNPPQVELEDAVREADDRAVPGTALLILGSALSWHQQLWAPLWTKRPLYYDNWLWYWHPDHQGTPGYQADAGHHYPDPERALGRGYLSTHGIGAVVATGDVKEAASRALHLELIRTGTYDVYRVVDPVTTVTFAHTNAEGSSFGNQRITASNIDPASEVQIRANWFPRWQGRAGDAHVPLGRATDGSIAIALTGPANAVSLEYAVQPLDWLARLLAALGVAGLVWFVATEPRRGSEDAHWYAQQSNRVTSVTKVAGGSMSQESA